MQVYYRDGNYECVTVMIFCIAFEQLIEPLWRTYNIIYALLFIAELDQNMNISMLVYRGSLPSH